MVNRLFQGTYINEDTKQSFPMGTPSQGYDATGKKIQSAVVKPKADNTGVPLSYINPETNDFFTPNEFVSKVKSTLPKQTYTIPKYAGDQLTEGPQTTEQLSSDTGRLSAEQGDIVSGTTDPYKVASKSGIAYSPEELDAIEKAYGGIYTPAIDTAIAKMKAQKDREDQIFQTNENIRQWKATTGSKSGGDSEIFTQTQKNNGASNAGVSISAFDDMDTDLKNFYIQNPMSTQTDENNKTMSVNDVINQAINNVKTGKEKAQDVSDEITNSKLAPSVKQYFISQIPLSVEEKEGYWSKIWNLAKAVTNL